MWDFISKLLDLHCEMVVLSSRLGIFGHATMYNARRQAQQWDRVDDMMMLILIVCYL